MTEKPRIPGEVYLFTTAIIWGAAFVFQKVAMDILEPFTFTAVRYILGGLLLIPVAWYFGKKNKSKVMPDNYSNKTLLIGGIICGTILCFAGNFQQFGLITSSAGKTGFITTLYIVIVPVFGLILFRKRVRKLVWLGVALAVVGL